MRRALQDALRDDAEWFKKTLGDSAAFEEKVLQVGGDQIADKVDNVLIHACSADRSNNVGSIDDIDFEAFEILGYAREETLSLKGSIRDVILSRNTIKPRFGIPMEWTINESLGDLRKKDREQWAALEGEASSKVADDDRDDRDKSNYFFGREVDPRDVQGAISVSKPASVPSGNILTNQDDSFDDERKKRIRRYESRRGIVDGELGQSFERERREERSRQKSSGSDIGETFYWRGAPPTAVELKNRLDSAEDDVMENDYLSQPPTFFPDQEEFKDLLIEESKARIQVTGDWMKPLVQAEAKWRYNIYKSFLSFVGTDLADGFDVESLMGENGQSNENRRQKKRRQEDNASMYSEWMDSQLSGEDGWTEITRDDQEGIKADYSSSIDKDAFFSEKVNEDEEDFAWDDKFIDEDSFKQSKRSSRSDSAYRTYKKMSSSPDSASSIDKADSMKVRSTVRKSRFYDLETDEY